jgi:predicted adenylyl cyclase CyaB
MPIIYEFKAKTTCLGELEKSLLYLNPVFKGTDYQTDTYFNTKHGRLKLREGNIEQALIHYFREDKAGAKVSRVLLYRPLPDNNLKLILQTTLGIKGVVEKKRKIYFIDNVKFHFDEVKELGTFVEVEAIDGEDGISIELLKEQCMFYAHLFGITPQDYIAGSYSDLLEL